MEQYTALLSCDGPIRTGLAHGFRFGVGGFPVDAEVRTWVEEAESGGWFYRGLRLLLRFTAPDQRAAVRIAEAGADHVLDLISLAAAAGAPPFRLETLYAGNLASKEIRVVRVLHDLPLPTFKLHKAYLSHLNPVLSKTVQVDDKLRERLFRGMRWYRRALRESDSVDRFLMLWIAVESLEPRFRGHWGLESQFRVCRGCGERLVCQECGNGQGRKHTPIGVDRLLANLPEGDDETGQRCRRLRSGIVHAYEDLPDVTEQAQELIPVLEKAFPWGVGTLLELEEDTVQSLARVPLETKPPYDAAVSVRLRGNEPGQLGPPGAFPFLDIRILPNVQFNDRGEPEQATFSTKISARVADGVRVEFVGGWLSTRKGTLAAFAKPQITVNTSQPWLAEDAKGVSLWAKGDREPVYPEGMRERK